MVSLMIVPAVPECADGSVNGLTLPSIKIEKIDEDDTLNHQEQNKDGNRSDDDSLFIPEVSGLSTIPYRM
jgi:hypothetical protein